MRRLDLFRNIKKKTGGEYKLKDIENIVEAYTEVVKEELDRGGKVSFSKFGTFTMVERKAIKRIIPDTNIEVEIPDRLEPTFIFSNPIKKRLRKELK